MQTIERTVEESDQFKPVELADEPGKPHIIGRILFADDDNAVRVSLGKQLQRAGFECDLAGSGARAIEMLRADAGYDVLLLDINMPGNENLELIEHVGLIDKALPCVLLTGLPTVETATRSVRLRVAAYLTKPVDFGELCHVLSSAISDYRSVRLLKENRRRLQDWEREIERVQQLLQLSSSNGRQCAMQDYLRLTLRNLIVGLVELEHFLNLEGEQSGGKAAIERQKLFSAVQKTIGVLERTRHHFKSRELGELRRELQGLIDGGASQRHDVKKVV